MAMELDEHVKQVESWKIAINSLSLNNYESALLHTPTKFGLTPEDIQYFWGYVMNVQGKRAEYRNNPQFAVDELRVLKDKIIEYVSSSEINKGLFKGDNLPDAQVSQSLERRRAEIEIDIKIASTAKEALQQQGLVGAFQKLNAQIHAVQAADAGFVALMRESLGQLDDLDLGQMRNAYSALTSDSVLTDEEIAQNVDAFSIRFHAFQKMLSDRIKAATARKDLEGSVEDFQSLLILYKLLEIFYLDTSQSRTSTKIRNVCSGLRMNIVMALKSRVGDLRDALKRAVRDQVNAALKDVKLPSNVDKVINDEIISSGLLTDVSQHVSSIDKNSFIYTGGRRSRTGGATATGNKQETPVGVSPTRQEQAVAPAASENAQVAKDSDLTDEAESQMEQYSLKEKLLNPAMAVALGFIIIIYIGYGDNAENLYQLLNQLTQVITSTDAVQDFKQGLEAISDAFSQLDTEQAAEVSRLVSAPSKLGNAWKELLHGSV